MTNGLLSHALILSSTIFLDPFGITGTTCGVTSSSLLTPPALLEYSGLCRGGSGRVLKSYPDSNLVVGIAVVDAEVWSVPQLLLAVVGVLARLGVAARLLGFEFEWRSILAVARSSLRSLMVLVERWKSER